MDLKRFIFAIILLLSTLHSINSYSQTDPTILVVGDSLSAAFQIAPESGWVALLEQKLKTQFPQATVINSSVVGDTTSKALVYLSSVLEQHHPSIVLLELGGNDGLRKFPIHEIKENLSKMITLCLQANAKVLLIGIRLPLYYNGPAYAKQFDEIYTQLKEEYNITLVPFLLDKVALHPELMFPDHIHPNAQAQPQLLENVWPYLMPLLPTISLQTNSKKGVTI